MIAAGVDGGATELGRWVEQLTSKLGGLETEAEIAAAIDEAAEDIDPTEFARVIEERLVHAAMLGAVDSMLERESDEEDPLPVLASWRSAILQRVGGKTKLSGMPFEQAVRLFEERQILPKEQFDQLRDAAKQKAFTIAGLAAEELLQETHAELARQIKESKEKTFFDEAAGKWVYKGPNLREFDKFARKRLEKAGWTPASRSHIETIFRTNVLGAYGSGRIIETTQPLVVAARPYWQIFAVGDSRSRPAHRKAHGTILSVDNPFWRKAYPPFGYYCRCRVVSRSKRWVDKHGGPTRVPEGLPDKGFASGIDASLVPSLGIPQQSERAPTPGKAARPLDGGVAQPQVPVAPVIPQPVALPTQKTPEIGKAFVPDGALAPIAPPKPAVKPTPSVTAADVMHQQIAGPGGSNAGGVFIGKDGVKRYVKLYSDPSQAAGEHIANQLYSDLGLGKVKSQLFEINGKTAYASQYLEGATPLGQMTMTPELAKQALDGLAADLVTANWDAVGLTLDNLVVTKGGQVVRIDNGGTFLMRAQAGRKPAHLLEQLTEWDGFFDPAINPTYARLARTAGVSSAAELLPVLRDKLSSLSTITERAGGWDKYVKKLAPKLGEADRTAISNMLEKRVELLRAKIRQAQAAASKPKPRIRLDELETETVPKFPATWPGGVAPKKENWREAADAIKARSAKDVRALISTEEASSIREFTGATYGSIRAAARLTKEEYLKSPLNEMRYEVAKEHANRINAALEKRAAIRKSATRIEDEITEAFRGIRDVPKARFEEIINLPKVSWAEPTSSSWHPSAAANFYAQSTTNPNYAVMFRIKPAQHTRALSIEGISGLAQEHEILWGNDVTFRVVKVVRDAGQERTAIVYLEELP